MVGDTVYSSAPSLRHPRWFLAQARADLGIAVNGGWRLFVRGMQARHRQTVLRYGWLVLPPLATTGVWVVLGDSNIVPVGDTVIPYAAFVMTGTLLWQLFVDALIMPMQRLVGARHVLTKARLPHESWVIAAVLDVLFSFGIRMVTLVILLLAVGVDPFSPTVLLFPLGAMALLLLGLGFGLLMAPIGLLFEDIGRATQLLLNVGFFLTPIVYPKPSGGGFAESVLALNPVTPLLVTSRAWITGSPEAVPLKFTVIAVCAAGLLVLAWAIYRLARPHVVGRL